MIPLSLTVTLRSPVHLGAKSTAGNFLAGLNYIPGRSLLGAVAWAWIDAGGDPGSPEFAICVLFLVLGAGRLWLGLKRGDEGSQGRDR